MAGMIMMDLDRTALRSDKRISDYTLAVLEKCRKAGYKIGIATARSDKAAERFTKAVKPDIMVSCCGSKVYYKGKIIKSFTIPADTANRLITDIMASVHFISVSADTDSGYYVTWDADHPDSPDYAHAVHSDFTTPLTEPVYKITAELSEYTAAAEISRKYPQCSLLTFTGENFYRFADVRSGKFIGIKAAADFLNEDIADVICFGDDNSDLDMLKGCGTGVAMANANEAAKAAADTVCGTNDDDGMARWLDAHLLRDNQ